MVAVAWAFFMSVIRKERSVLDSHMSPYSACWAAQIKSFPETYTIEQ